MERGGPSKTWCALFVVLASVLLGRLAEGAAKKPTEMALIRKSGIGCQVGD